MHRLGLESCQRQHEGQRSAELHHIGGANIASAHMALLVQGAGGDRQQRRDGHRQVHPIDMVIDDSLGKFSRNDQRQPGEAQRQSEPLAPADGRARVPQPKCGNHRLQANDE